MNNNKIIVGIGEILWDMFPTGKKVGGAPMNFAYHCSQLGAKGKVISSLGDDSLGREIFDVMKNNCLDNSYVTINKKYPTGSVNVIIDENGKPEYEICKNVAWDFIEFNDKYKDLAINVDACCFGTLAQRNIISKKNIQLFLKYMPLNSIKIFDINLRQNFYSLEIIENSLKIANVLKISDEELPIVANLLNLNGGVIEQLNKIRKLYNLKVIIYSRGPNGSILLSENEIDEHPGCPGKAINSVGAGDSFTATFCVGYLSGKSLKQINNHANKVATFVCMQETATPKLPNELIKL